MTTLVAIEISGDDKVEALLGMNLDPVLRVAALAVGELIRAEIATYPPEPEYPLAWSVAEREAYKRMRLSRGLPLKYTRNSDPMSQRLGPSWTVAPYGQTGAVVGTRVSYAARVQSAAEQHPMFAQIGWITDEQAIANVKASGDIERVVDAAIGRAFAYGQG